MKAVIREAIGYFAASVGALIVDMAFLWVLVRFFSWWYLPAASLSFIAGATVAYLLSLKLAFKQHRLRDRRAEFVGFVTIGTAGLAINAGVISLGVRYFGLHYLLAKFVASGVTFSCNFVARRQLLFVRHPSG